MCSSDLEIDENIENESFSTTWVDPKQCLNPSQTPKKWPVKARKRKKWPKIKSKSNVRIERKEENEIRSTTWAEPKTVVKPYHNANIAH